jgi:branched-chain amino acid transport system ATP-binding protein
MKQGKYYICQRENNLMDTILKTESLSKNFGALQAVLNVNLNIQRGTIHSVIGPNGAGKTTLFNLLTGFLQSTSGKIYFQNKDITKFPPYKISQLGIGRSFQITSIFPELSVRENIRIVFQSRTKTNYRFLNSMNGLRSLEEKAQEILNRIGLGDKGDSLAKNLSHGEKRILDIGIGLASEPELLLLDEPASGLVGDEILRVTDLVKTISNFVTIVLVEHNIDVVLSISNIITVLYYGEAIAEGKPEEIQNNEKVQEIYLGDYR